MAILNVTPDSAFEGSRHPDPSKALETALRHIEEGADWIDIGGESTYITASEVTEEEELQRVIPVIEKIRQKSTLPLSIDTRKPRVAEEALRAGVNMINDVEGFRNPQMREVAAKWKVAVCLMHMQGIPQTMQQNPTYPKGCVHEIVDFFKERIALCCQEGMVSENIIIDPGIGFGKSVAHNLEILDNLSKFKELGYPVLVGPSRKWFLTQLLNKPRSALLPGTLACSSKLVLAGVDYIRVHDVWEHRDLITLLTAVP